jgi:phage terminase large subunit GpA-like protein
MNRVIAVKGVPTTRTIVGAPKAVDVTVSGRRLTRGYKVWPIGIDIAKGEFYGWLRLRKPTDESGLPFPPGFCHFPEYGEDYFKEITAEHLVKVVKRTGFVNQEWQVIPGRENHRLDCRVYARAAAMLVGLDRKRKTKPGAAATAAQTAAVLARAAANVAVASATPVPAPTEPTTPPPPPPLRRGTWLRGSRGAISGGSWIRR